MEARRGQEYFAESASAALSRIQGSTAAAVEREKNDMMKVSSCCCVALNMIRVRNHFRSPDVVPCGGTRKQVWSVGYDLVISCQTMFCCRSPFFYNFGSFSFVCRMCVLAVFLSVHSGYVRPAFFQVSRLWAILVQLFQPVCFSFAPAGAKSDWMRPKDKQWSLSRRVSWCVVCFPASFTSSRGG